MFILKIKYCKDIIIYRNTENKKNLVQEKKMTEFMSCIIPWEGCMYIKLLEDLDNRKSN